MLNPSKVKRSPTVHLSSRGKNTGCIFSFLRGTKTCENKLHRPNLRFNSRSALSFVKTLSLHAHLLSPQVWNINHATIHPTVRTRLKSPPWTFPLLSLHPQIHPSATLPPQATTYIVCESLYSLHRCLPAQPPSHSDQSSSLCNVTLSPAMLVTSNLSLTSLRS